jgi:nucleoside-diphosphate-sugar epimerase
MKEKSVLVTGVAGMQGRALAKDLVNQEKVAFVYGIDDFSRNNYLDEPRDWAKSMEKESRKFHFGNMRYQNLKASDLADFDAIIHLAAFVSVPESIVSREQQERYRENNAIGPHDLLLKLRYDIPKERWPVFVYASTAETFGDTLVLPYRPECAQNPQSPYAACKLFGEVMVNVFAKDYDYPGVAVRSFNTFGPNQNCGFEESNGTPEAAVVALFIKKALTGEDLHVHGDGRQTRDFQFVGDMITAYRRLALSDKVDENGLYYHRGKKYNLGTGRDTSIDRLADMIISISGSNSKKVNTPIRPGEIMAMRADFSDIVRDTGYQSTVKLEDGLKIAIDWYRQNLKDAVKPAAYANRQKGDQPAYA